MKKSHVLFVLIISCMLLASCTPGPNSAVNISSANREVAGFWLGFWHGMISPVTLVISILQENVGVYEIHNNGIGYNFGFCLIYILFFLKFTFVTLNTLFLSGFLGIMNMLSNWEINRILKRNYRR